MDGKTPIDRVALRKKAIGLYSGARKIALGMKELKTDLRLHKKKIREFERLFS